MDRLLSPDQHRQYINDALRNKIAFWSSGGSQDDPFPNLRIVLERLQAQGNAWPRTLTVLAELMRRFQDAPQGLTYDSRNLLLNDLNVLTLQYNAMAAHDRALPLRHGDPSYDTEPDGDPYATESDSEPEGGGRHLPPLQALPWDPHAAYAGPVAQAFRAPS